MITRKHLIRLADTLVPSSQITRIRNYIPADYGLFPSIVSRGRLHDYGDNDRKEFFSLIRSVRKETDLLLEDIEAYTIFMAVKRTKKVKGDIAEVGVYRGGSATIICAAKGERHLFLFDTFEGLPQVDSIDAVWPFYEGKFHASFEEVRKYLARQSNVSIYKGIFPATGTAVKDRSFSMVNLDVDTFQSTKDCLEFFYPLMSPGGIILSHDYLNTPGVRKAFDDFFADKPEPVLETSASQCIVVKI